jgi:exopolyphosphatase/pppGpp-phosphohydrolase
MNYTEVINSIKKASLFDLYRLNVAIHHEMENPERIAQIRNAFREGDLVSYFDAKNNKLEQARVLQKNLKYVVVENVRDHRRWNIQYFLLNLAKVDVDIHAGHNAKLSRNTLKVGDFVGFNKDGATIVGVIVRINHKTVSFITNGNCRWRVAYAHLFRIIDADIINQFDQKQVAFWLQEEKKNKFFKWC